MGFKAGGAERARSARGMWARTALACAAVLASARAWPGGAVCAQRVAAAPGTGAGGARYVAFLSLGPGPPALVESSWAGRGRLLACWARRDPRLVRAFRAACARRPPGAPGAALRRELGALWRRRAACTDPEPRGERRRRRRRGWTVPGTLWCGAGDSAGNATELGTGAGTAPSGLGSGSGSGGGRRALSGAAARRCLPRPRPVLPRARPVRGADHGAAVQLRHPQLPPAHRVPLRLRRQVRRGLSGVVPGPRRGCRGCRGRSTHPLPARRFRRCLLALNDTISNIIGVTFFNLLEVPCFVLEDSEECVQWHWWGG